MFEIRHKQEFFSKMEMISCIKWIFPFELYWVKMSNSRLLSLQKAIKKIIVGYSRQILFPAHHRRQDQSRVSTMWQIRSNINIGLSKETEIIQANELWIICITLSLLVILGDVIIQWRVIYSPTILSFPMSHFLRW